MEEAFKNFSNKSNESFYNLLLQHNKYIDEHQKNFEALTAYIEKDYQSLTISVKNTNDQLNKLIQQTNNNIIKNNELKPLLVNSSEELRKVYDQIKLFFSSYEKNLKDVKSEAENTLRNIEEITDGKIKQLTANGEKMLNDITSYNVNSIERMREETNIKIEKVFKEDLLAQLIEKIEMMEKDFATKTDKLESTLLQIDTSVQSKIEEYLVNNDNSSKRKGFFGR